MKCAAGFLIASALTFATGIGSASAGLIENGDFESGTTGWSILGKVTLETVSSSTWAALGSPFGVLSQSFTILTTGNYTLSFAYFTNASGGSLEGDLVDSTLNTNMGSMSRSSGASGTYVVTAATLTAGHVYTITLAGVKAAVDDVSLTFTGTPTVAPGPIAGAGLPFLIGGAVWLTRRRKAA